MDFYHSAFKDVLRYIIYPILDPLSKMILSSTLYNYNIKNIKLTLDQLIILSTYPNLIDYFSSNKCDIKKGFLYIQYWGLHSCKWYSTYIKSDNSIESRRLTFRFYEKINSYYDEYGNIKIMKCTCIKCIDPDYCTVNDIRVFLKGIMNIPPTKKEVRFRSKYENRLYMCGLIISEKKFDLSKPPFHQMLKNKMGEYLLYFAIRIQDENSIINLTKCLGIHEIDHALRWLPNSDFTWFLDNYNKILTGLRIINWVLSVVSRDRTANYLEDK